MPFINEEDLVRRYLNIYSLPVKINSPFRQDRNPSLSIWSTDGKVHYKDFGTNETGSIYTFLSKYWGKSFYEVLRIIIEDLDIKGTTPLSSTTSSKVKKTVTDLQVKIRNWETYDETYWNTYGIPITLLNQVKVRPISHFIINKQTYKADRHAYVFIENKDSITIKIYQPFNLKLKWLTNHNSSVISLWTFLPKQGDTLCICASLKDALCLYYNTGIPCIALQGEGYMFKPSVIKELTERFKHIYILFDNDEPGIQFGKHLAEKTGFIYKELPQFEGGKDISDMYKTLGLQQFKQIILSLII